MSQRRNEKLDHYQQLVAQYYNTGVHNMQFWVGDQGLHKVFQNTQELNAEKLKPNWEGPYMAILISRPHVYQLQDTEKKGSTQLDL